MNEFLEQFVLESRELVEQATGELLALETHPDDRQRLDSAFRAFHTLKGGANIVDFAAMSRAVHAAEDALSAVRSGDIQMSADLIDDCLAAADQVVQWLDEVQATGNLPVAPENAADAIVARFGYRLDPKRNEETHRPAESERSDGLLSPAARRILDEQLLLIAENNPAGREGRIASAARVAANLLRRLSIEADAVRIEQSASTFQASGDTVALVDAITQALGERKPAATDTNPPARADVAARTLRVDADRVNALVNLTGELIVAKNAIAHIAKSAGEGSNPLAPVLREEHARLERLMAELQQAVLSLRVLPLRIVFQRFLRVVRELAVDLGKPANLTIEGEDTEADKAIVEMLFEPLLHLVRNAMDHGIETAPERAAAGKPAIANIRLLAHRQGEHVIVEVTDDGRGVDIARVRQAAAERSIVTEGALSEMSDQDVLELILLPGISTASRVTDLSGRGVGMDAVRTAVERIGGHVTVKTEPGRGSTVRFALPFSLMITRVMTVEAGGQIFGIPLDAVVETIRLPRDRIQAIGSAGAFVVRNRTIPLIDLAGTLGKPSGRRRDSEALAVIASISGQWGALEVDRLGERMDVMLRPIDGLLSGMPGIAGTTLTGDGQVLLILDLQSLLG